LFLLVGKMFHYPKMALQKYEKKRYIKHLWQKIVHYPFSGFFLESYFRIWLNI